MTAPTPEREADQCRSLTIEAILESFSPAGPMQAIEVSPAFHLSCIRTLIRSSVCDVLRPHRCPAETSSTFPLLISRYTGASALPSRTRMSYTACFSSVPKNPPAEDKPLPPASGALQAAMSLQPVIAPEPVRGPVANTSLFSG